MRSTMTIPALNLMRYLDQIEFPCQVYGSDWEKPLKIKGMEITRERLCDLINRGLVRGIGSWKKLRRIHLICTDNLAVVSYCKSKPTRNKAKFPIKSQAGSTTYRERLQHGVLVQHHQPRCEAWPHTGGKK
jgi:hypothetical protein